MTSVTCGGQDQTGLFSAQAASYCLSMSCGFEVISTRQFMKLYTNTCISFIVYFLQIF